MGLHFRTLGTPELLVRDEGSEGCLRLRYRKAYAMLGYLAVERDRWHERRRLADFFWPHLAPEAALANLRQVLKSLGDVFGATGAAHCLRVERDRLGLFFAAPLHADILLLDDGNRDALRRCAGGEAFGSLTAGWRPWLQQLEGDFLAGFDSDDAAEFDDWLVMQRAWCERARAAFLRDHFDAARRCGSAGQALQAARIWVRCQPTDDEAAHAQMDLLAALGQGAAALDAYADFAQRLRQLVDAAPGPRIEALRQRIAGSAAVPAPAARPACDEVRRVVVLRIEPDLDDADDALEPERHLAPLAAALDDALRHWRGRQFPVSGWSLGAVFGLADDGEQAPRRALMAALEVAALQAFGRTRIGICEGKALIRPEESHPLAGSALPALAQRFALCGDPGDVILASSLAGELGVHARYEPLAQRRFTGLSGNHAPCRLVAAPDLANGLFPTAFATPFVGRGEELSLLAAAIDRAGRNRRAEFLELVGPAGNGKSRLLAELAARHRAAGGEIRWIAHHPELRHASLGALREAVRQRVDALDAQAPAERLDHWLARAFPARRETLRAPLRAFLGLGAGDASGMAGRSIVDALITLLFSPSRKRLPALLVFDDMHWADEATRELLHIAVQSSPAVPVLAVLACRPGSAIDWPEERAAARLDLRPLAVEESQALIAAVDRDGSIGTARRTQLAKMSGGLPLCVEYMARAARDRTVSDASLFGVLQSALDRLGEDKRVMQAASVFGVIFQGASLQALLPGSSCDAALQRAEQLSISSALGGDVHAFRHALLRDCAYGSIPPRQRRDWHRSAAAWHAAQPHAAQTDIAQHFEAAEAWPEAYEHWRRAAEAAYMDEFAGEAKEAAVRALAAAGKGAEPLAAESKAELELLAGYATLMTEGYGAKHAQRFFAPSLARRSGDLSDETLFRALCGMAAATPTGGQQMQDIMQRLERMARTPAQRMIVCYGYGSFRFWRGEFAESVRNLEEAIRIGETIPAREWLRYSADHPAIGSRCLLAINLAFCGAGTAGVEAAETAMADARREGRAHGLCFAFTMAASVHRMLDRPQETERLAAAGLKLATQWRFPLWQAYNTMQDLWAKARQGKLRLASTFKLVSMHREFAVASRLSPVTALWFIAAVCEAAQNWTLLDAVTARALRLIDTGGDRYCLPDLLRQKAAAKLGRGDVEAAARHFEEARALGEAMGCRGLEPRFERDAERIAAARACREGFGSR